MTQNAEWQTGSEPAEWTWDEPDPGWHAPCRRLEATGLTSPLDRAGLAGIGVTGIQFGSWDGRDPGCLNTDVIGLVAGDTRTEPGRVYRVDGRAYFVRLDARDPLPLADGCVDWAYAEHFIEHLTLAEGIGWLREVRRILAVGGWLRLTTPDLHRYVAGYLDDGANGFFARHRRRLMSLGAKPEDLPERKAFMVNQIFQFHGHKWIYDLDELRHALGTAGFDPDAISVRSFGRSALPHLAALDRAVRNDETIYVDVRRTVTTGPQDR
ncbi:class I SAM-dependent methyltransferase [Plantactinospora sp. KLBMP9567]|uniref:class I SAM-dependent methyltransferase n=1 Tax=Plantactinospora sp. KLBMP9567 TaxID=3085900 RepID=UPI002980E16E|nr:methyltransferase domain-containing protein [Plantactinospora sp. KLBMP9567]MDW5324874.1 methyltransferase domain-containing protein [Plantactinospora sp. KLBMP9567]